MKKSQNLKLILVVEVVVILCICIGVVGIMIYAGGSQPLPASEKPAIEIPTATLIPENVPTSEAAAAETSAVTQIPGMKGMTLEKQPDGTTKFTDYDGGYEVAFPTGWLAARPGDDEFNTALAKEGAKNTVLAEQMKLNKTNYDAEFDRLFSYPLRPDIQKNAVFGFSITSFDPKDDMPINNNSMGDFVRKFESSNVAPGFRVTASNIMENGNKISFMVMKGRFSKKTDSGDMVPFYVTALFFKPTPKSLACLTFTILQDYQKQISPDLDAIRESIKLLGQ
jgi:hypothetical protein